MKKTKNIVSILNLNWLRSTALIFLTFSSFVQGMESADLTSILHQIEQDSPQLKVDKAKADAAKAGVNAATSEYWGRISLYGRDVHYNNDRLISAISPPVDFSQLAVDNNQYAYGAAFFLPLDINGKISAKVHAQQQFNQAANFAVENSRLQLFSQAVFVYRNLQRLIGIREALSKQHRALEKHYNITETAIRVGRLAKVELLRIEAEIKAVESRLAVIDGDDARLRANLAALLNQPQFTKMIFKSSTLPIPLSLINKQALKQRPDILRFQSLTSAENENIKEARSAWLPRFNLQADVSKNSGYGVSGTGVWSISAQVQWDLWDGRRRDSQISQARAKKQVALQQQVVAANRAKAEFDAALSGWKASQLQYTAAQAGLKAAIETEKIQSDRYQNGRLSSVDLLDAESTLALARSNLSSALAFWWLADDQLNLALGKEPHAYYSKTGRIQ